MAIEKSESLLKMRTTARRAIVIGVVLVGAILISVKTASSDDREKVAAGEEVYNTYCSPCHGDELKNTGQTFDLRRLTANDRQRFEHSVLTGKNQMPPWKGVLTTEQIDQLWHFIRHNAFQK